ncbi:uncharacterized protein M6B38_271160 [Iris pallida]|uniref:Uncharacterized protein n=1 Tax=Iris pallida TaxID=29817 RepID=A0AAX6I732_IRIPA|nr:uncharacterized protein M6B38_271160 [Iris pallida]
MPMSGSSIWRRSLGWQRFRLGFRLRQRPV